MTSRPLIIQQRLRNGDNLDKLCHDFSIRYFPHAKFPDLVWLMHNGFNLNEVLTQQCRGLILDRANNWNVVARPLDHIFEYTDLPAPKFDWKGKLKPRVFDKVDGVSINLYYIKRAEAWFVASRKSPEAANQIGGQPLHKLFWDAFDGMGYHVPPRNMTDYTFVWEMVGPLVSPVLTSRAPRDKNQLSLIAIRHNETGEELDTTEWCLKGERDYIDVFEDTSNFKNLGEVMKVVRDTGLKSGEGYIVMDQNFRRVAVTHPDYDAARAFRQHLSIEYLVRNCRSKEVHENVKRFAADWLPMHTIVAKSYIDLIKRIWKARKRHALIVSDNLYANTVAQYPWGEVLVKIRQIQGEAAPGTNSVTVSEVLQEFPPTQVLDWLEVPGAEDEEVAA